MPQDFDWESWLGVQSERPYSSGYVRHWRGWYDFGAGALGDMGLHILGAAHMALMLGAPTSVECVRQEGRTHAGFPKKTLLRFEFPARGTMSPVTVEWYDGMTGPPPRPEGLGEDEILGDMAGYQLAGGETVRPGQLPQSPGGRAAGKRGGQAGQPGAGRGAAGAAFGGGPSANGSLSVGDKGFLASATYGEPSRLLPAEKMKNWKLPPQLLTRSPGHHQDWIRAAKGGAPACSNFEVAGPFAEWVLLGALATQFDTKLVWDSAKMKITNVPAANQFIKPVFRKGWSWT